MSLLALVVSGCAVTSDPIERSVSEQRARTDLQNMYKDQEPLSGPLTLHQAMARAVKYNLEGRLKIMEEALAKRQLDLASFDMLPRMALDAGYVGRNNVNASSSQSVETGTQSLEPSTSQDRDREVADLTMVWNVLDFGVSYISAKQAGDQRLIVQERRRKVINTIVQDVRSAYWRAMAAERLLKQIDSLMARVEAARDNSQSMSEQRIGDPVQALGYQRSLIQATRQLEEQRRALSLAKTELATLINLPLGTELTLATQDEYVIPELKVDLARLEQEALASRPELREQDYQTRITAAETRKAMLRLLPGLEFSAGGHYDSNSFLVEQGWADYGVKVTWNLFNVISAPAAIDVAKAGEEVASARRQAMSIAVLAQLYVANANYREALRQFKTSQQLSDIDGQIVGQLRNRHQAAGIGELDLIQGELNTLQADLRRDLAYADLRNAYGQIFASAGLDPLPNEVQSTAVQSIATALANREAAWAQGDITVPTTAAVTQ
ncbi:Outer membrane protein TolC [Pseudomonas sp. NFACC48-1]|nr:Outer membrane protein TolC [Pseudomonas sp. NFACC05-1]SCZ35400.1 Outer membrane protein TolC [Pseudomonas sp. NFACC44-2]SDA82353.1 Outer membrane protein TolC [Pseudomonas sp. NFACC51]SDW73672.1 Outer membrane protein TolC [Pseudomonas sp. NFACC08-1]SEJ65335.1 Outer membrane protein TolC [Pseudomonas sp. NFACC07-1]SFI60121.1 Outer membrane protein TolC [Pseudomonas sp. NFACC54]SFL45382.1 Outer membrane protein TolC [Pseudomonas sp. NFACC46-3]SFT19751.1 Outer membrane protein TolC [Pseudo